MEYVETTKGINWPQEDVVTMHMVTKCRPSCTKTKYDCMESNKNIIAIIIIFQPPIL